MPAPRQRSRKKRRVRVKTPGGKARIRYEKRRSSKAKCGRCGRELHGVPNLRSSELRKLSHSERVPERPYGGVLCGNCFDRLIRYKHRFEVKFKSPEFKELELKRDLTLEKFLPKDWWKNLTSSGP